MSEQELEKQDVSEDTSEDRLVPVAEAIRYRRRAQAAEKELAEMKAERDLLQSEKQAISNELGRIKQDQEIHDLLAAAGTSDPETVLLLVRDRLASAEDSDVQTIVDQLQQEKGWLFSRRPASGGPMRTAGEHRRPNGSAVLQDAAKKAARSGNCVDVQEYLRVRRQFF